MTDKRFDVALSFAGKDRVFVQDVAKHLKQKNIKVFYDEEQAIFLWGKDLVDALDDVYRAQSKYVVIFISKHYAKSMWTDHERRSALAQAIQQRNEFILPARFDDTELPGIKPTVSYLDLRNETPETFALKIAEKIGVTGQSVSYKDQAVAMKSIQRTIFLIRSAGAFLKNNLIGIIILALVTGIIGNYLYDYIKGNLPASHTTGYKSEGSSTKPDLVNPDDSETHKRSAVKEAEEIGSRPHLKRDVFFPKDTYEVKVDPQDATVYFDHGLAKYNLKQYAEAIKDYDKAIELDPKLAAAYNNRGNAKYYLKQYAEAIKDYDKAIELDPKYADAYYNRGLAKYYLKQYAEAKKDYGKAIELDPQIVDTYDNYTLDR